MIVDKEAMTPGAGVSVTFSSSALSPRASRTHLLSHQCQMGRLECHVFGHLAERGTSVPITELISTQDPKQPFLVHILPSVGCWENSSSTKSPFDCCVHDVTLAVAVKSFSEGCIRWVGMRFRPGGCPSKCTERKLWILFLET